MTTCPSHPASLIRYRRRIHGASAVLLPFCETGAPDWGGFESHLARTLEAGLTPAINMDTGFVNLIDEPLRREVCGHAATICAGRELYCGVYVADSPGSPLDTDTYRRGIATALSSGAVPVLFQSHGLTSLDEEEIPGFYRDVARTCERFIAFELGSMFAPFGRIYSLDTYAELMRIPQCIGVKHSSLHRAPEWERLALRDRLRPDFRVFTGNDLAIDMVMYGSDYLLGISTFAPGLFALRDRFWAEGDSRFHELNDLLQYLGCFAFRPPVPAYKHSAAQFLQLLGCIDADTQPTGALRRPDSDREILQAIIEQLKPWKALL